MMENPNFWSACVQLLRSGQGWWVAAAQLPRLGQVSGMMADKNWWLEVAWVG
jgi:hypothetical protein